MLNFLKNVFSLSDKTTQNAASNEDDINSSPSEYYVISHILEINKNRVKEIFNNFSDLIIREIKIANNPHLSAMLIYINNLIDANLLERSIIEKLTNSYETDTYNLGSKEYSQYLLGIRDEDIYTDMNIIINSILKGKVALFIDGLNQAMVLNINKAPSRDIQEPQVESLIRGLREGFTESLITNIALIRKKIKRYQIFSNTFQYCNFYHFITYSQKLSPAYIYWIRLCA